jgi:integrase
MFLGERYQLSDARQDGAMKGSRWRDLWYRAIDTANARITEGNRGVPEDQWAPMVPRYRPHTCRHTAASWLVQSGVPLYDIQKLLGHASFATT